jgi:hypothetical protein
MAGNKQIYQMEKERTKRENEIIQKMILADCNQMKAVRYPEMLAK